MTEHEAQARYVLCPGWVSSVNDGDRHFIGYDQLMGLYGLRPNQCERYDEHRRYPDRVRFLYPMYHKSDYDRIRKEIADDLHGD
jgi:hypothetical protein